MAEEKGETGEKGRERGQGVKRARGERKRRERKGKRPQGLSVPLHALDASIFFANNVRVNYPHRYQSDEGGGAGVAGDGGGRKRPALISRQSEN